MTTPERLPEIRINYIAGPEPWQVLDATVPADLERLDTDRRQLISWLTLPLATEAINNLIVDPLAEQGHDAGLAIRRNDYLVSDLDDTITKLRKKLQGGSAQPPFVHIANNPEAENQLTLLVPTARSRFKHNFVELNAKYRIINARGTNMENPPRDVIVVADYGITRNRKAADIKTEVPGGPDLSGSPATSDLPFADKGPLGVIGKSGECSGSRF